MSLVDVSDGKNSRAPLRTASLPQEAYVLSLASLPSFYAASASAPSNAIHLFDKTRLQATQTLGSPHGTESSAISSLRYAANVGNAASAALLSSGRDGTVKAWDERAPSGRSAVALTLTAQTAGRPRALLSCDASQDGLTIAAGTDFNGEDASILYWDPRNPVAPLYTHASTHSEDITALHFLRNGVAPLSTLLSASSDGLVCTSNAAEKDEDEAGIHVGNWGCSVAQAGWVRDAAGRAGVWAASDMETFGVWSNELDRIHDVDIRQPSLHRQDKTWVTDYLIGCHNTHHIPSGADNDLHLFVGSNEGDVALVTRPTFSDPGVAWLLHQTWSTGHVGVVRAALWDESNNVLLTGGEDAKLNVWSAPTSSSGPAVSVSSPGKRGNSEDAMDVDADVPSAKKRRA